MHQSELLECIATQVHIGVGVGAVPPVDGTRVRVHGTRCCPCNGADDGERMKNRRVLIILISAVPSPQLHSCVRVAQYESAACVCVCVGVCVCRDISFRDVLYRDFVPRHFVTESTSS